MRCPIMETDAQMTAIEREAVAHYDQFAPAIFGYLGMALGDECAAGDMLVEVFARAAAVADAPTGLPHGTVLLEIARECVLEHPRGCASRLLDLEASLTQASSCRTHAEPAR